jgi:hypothetical protein
MMNFLLPCYRKQRTLLGSDTKMTQPHPLPRQKASVLTSWSLRIVQNSPRARVAPSIFPWNLYLNLTHRSFFFLRHLTAFRPDPFSIHNRKVVIGVRGFSILDVANPCFLEFPIFDIPMRSFWTLAPPGYAPVHVTSSYMTVVIFLIRIHGFEC